MTQPPSPSPFTCPRCAISMYVGQAGGMTLHGCGRCGGVWLGRACAQRLAEALPQEAIELATRGSSGAALTVDVSPDVRCPACREPMQRTHVAAAKLDLDVCASHGTWYDRHELKRVAQAIGRARWQRRGVAAAGAAGAVVAGAVVAGAAAPGPPPGPGQQQEGAGVSDGLVDGADIAVEVVGEGVLEVVAEGAVAVVEGAFALIGALFD